MKDTGIHSRVTRRTALNSGLAVAAGSLVMLRNPLEILGASSPYSSEIVSWQSLNGQTFRVDCSGENGEPIVDHLTLVQIKPIETSDPNRPAQLRPQAVSLLFKADSKKDLPSASFKFSNSSIRPVEMLISQTRDDRFPSAVLYEAVLN